MKPIAILYGSSGDNTKAVAQKIASRLEGSRLLDVASAKPEIFQEYDFLILGTSTWHAGDLQDDWDRFLPQLLKADLNGKTIALFGLGDSSSYSDTFTDGMGQLYEALQGKGCTIVGDVSTEGYSFDASRSVVDGRFVGLALDEDNEYKQTDQRIDDWLKSIVPAFS